MHDHQISSSVIGFARTLHLGEFSPDSLLPRHSGEIESRDATASSQSLQDLQAQKAAAEEKAAAMHAEMVAFTKQVADAEAKSRADRKVRPINSACSCELDMLPQACCQETQYVPQHFEGICWSSVLQCSVAR